MDKVEQGIIIEKLCKPGKGILAADESTGTIGKRFASINVENNLENRTKYRNLLFTTPKLEEYISGVITYEETLLQENEGKKLIEPLIEKDIVIGIKVDKGVKPLYGTEETVTQGLDDLDKRCKLYYDAGARFAKWRAVLKIDCEKNLPSSIAIHENSVTLARYASICQNNGLVPIVEPEILMDGNHTIEKSKSVTINVLSSVYRELIKHNVDIEYTLLKPNMVRSGVNSNETLDFSKIAKYTLKALQNTVPVCMPGIVFLSGGMSEIEATTALNEINKNKCKKPWYLTFSFGRALQASVLNTWKGENINIKNAQNKLFLRASANGQSTLGLYNGEDDFNLNENLHEINYVY